ncbi:MAG TPA: carboxypeptidase-like regulatory domain-containing protein [Bryobacteraceae bacterium]|nr:carboxypeptidase-like regulatory domain-containing protein [Bryobacteraceae bacterium]
MSRLLLLIALSSAMSLPMLAQVASAELSGTVIDAAGAAVPNAKVIATNVATNVVHETVSGASGNYIIPLLPPGEYLITVEATGFRKLIQKGLTLQINQQAQLDLALQVGQVSESVEVSAQAPLLESESSSLGTVVNEKLVSQLPLNGRNFIQLAILSPGVTGQLAGGREPGETLLTQNRKHYRQQRDFHWVGASQAETVRSELNGNSNTRSDRG